MSTLLARKTVREELAALIVSDITFVEKVHDHIPNTFSGKSPVVTTPSDDLFPEFELNSPNNVAVFMVTVWSLRIDIEASIDRCGDAEDDIDQFANEFSEVVETWDQAEFSRASQTGYGVMDGFQYRIESHFVSVELER